MIVRTLDTVEARPALMDADKPVDGAIVLRALYEEVVGFLWIAANPEERLDRWAEGTRYQELKVHNDALVYDVKVLNRREVALARTARQLAAPAQRADRWTNTREAG